MRAQLLADPRPTDLLAVVRQLTLPGIDPTAAVAPSADLVCWSRRGTFTVHAVHEDVPFSPQVSRAVHDELRDLASWLSLTAEGLR